MKKMDFGQCKVVGEPRRWKNITVFWLSMDAGKPNDFVLASRSLGRGKLQILETPDFREVKLRSTSRKYTLVPEGTLLIGGKQDRTVNTSVFIAPHSEVVAMVSCVENNRWDVRPGVDPTRFTIATSMVGPNERSILKSTTGDGHRANQHTVWQSVNDTVTSLGAGEGAGTLHQAHDATESFKDEALEAFAFVSGSNGIAVAIGGEIRTIEFFNNPRKLSQICGQIISGHLVDRAVGDVGVTVSEEELMATLATLDTSEWRGVTAASSGTEMRSPVGNGQATAIYQDDSLVHASVVFR